ncbi:MAG: sensor histidine kinase [Rhodospirillales bacterium]|nr:sensor histidine kinase [Rhodospirillales bacterium]
MLSLLLIALPIAAFASYGAFVKREDDLADARDQLLRQATELATAQRAAVAGARQLLTVFAQGLAYRELLAAGCTEAGGAQEALGEFLPEIVVLDRAGGQVCRPGAAAPLSPSVQDLFEAVRGSSRFGLRFALVSPSADRGSHLIAGMPIVADRALRGVVVARLELPRAPPDRNAALPAGVSRWIAGARGAPWIGLGGLDHSFPAAPRPLEAMASEAGVFESVSADGAGQFVAVVKATDDSFAVAATPSEPVLRKLNFDLAVRLGLILLWFAVGFLLVKLAVRYSVLNPLRSLTNAIRSYGGAAVPFRPPADLASMPTELRELAARFSDVADANAARETNLNRLVEQRDLLVREIHHRVKNNLQIVTSLLNLQAQRIRNPAAREALFAARERVSALSLLHRHLYLQQDVDAIDFRSFLQELAEQLSAVMEGGGRDRVAIDVQAPTIRLASDQVVPLGLVVTEVITNAFKHGFTDDRGGAIRVGLRILDDQQAELTIANDGHHEADVEASEEATGGLGRLLIAGFVQQLDGTLETSPPGEPYRMTLCFPVKVADAPA